MYVTRTTVLTPGGVLLNGAIQENTLSGARGSGASISGITKRVPSAIAGIT